MTLMRLKVLRYFLLKTSHNVSLKEMMRLFFDTSYRAKTKRMIERIEVEEGFQKITFKNYDIPLYFPINIPFSSLERVVGESFYETNWHFYEIPQTRVSADDIVVDCGAAEGLFSLLVFSRCKQVYMIEPLPSFCNALKKTFEKIQNIQLLPVGVSSQEGLAEINDDDISSSLSLGSGEIKVSTLDNLFYEKNIPVSYIKIDVEGFDVEALKGASKLIKKYKPKIAVTTYHNFSHASQIKELLLFLVPEYKILTKGIYQETGSPVMLHAWVEN